MAVHVVVAGQEAVSFDKVRRGLRKVGSVSLGFAIRSQKGGVEDGVNTPLARKF